MNRIQVLDCTLRDGGYCNQWNFGYENIKKIINNLIEANIDIIECGFITNTIKSSQDITKYTSFEELSDVIPKEKAGKIFVGMINYNEYDVKKIPLCDGKTLDGIRIAFHKKNLNEAIKLCSIVKKKGYKVFVQAMVSLNYSDVEFLDMIKQVNELDPYAFYIVDSFGSMKKRELIRLFYLVEHNLNSHILVGFHSHNNMQLAYSNAQSLISINISRNIIIDSSVYGMGRGAGNLNTEILIEYLNEANKSNYYLKPLLHIMDEILNEFYQRNYWGFSLPNYLSASHNIHPNYASYLDDKKTLLVEDMDKIFCMIDSEKAVEFDKDYITQLYMQYMIKDKNQDSIESVFKAAITNKEVLLIAPGKSSISERNKILDFISQNNVVVIGVNFEYKYANTDYIFISNFRRFNMLDYKQEKKCIATSNINSDDVFLKVQYEQLLNEYDSVKDNAGMMAIKLLINNNAKKIYLAGFDGYSHESENNYAENEMILTTKRNVLDDMNKGMEEALRKYQKEVDIAFLTTPRYIKL